MTIPKIINKNRYHSIEREEFSVERITLLTKIEVKRFVRKICQHFKQEPITLKFHRKRKLSGLANWETRTIRLCYDPSVLLVAHELAHIFTKSGHTKRSLAMLEKIVLYSRKKNFWRKLEQRWLIRRAKYSI